MTPPPFGNKLFRNLIWPAVAGNVLWSFFTLLTEVLFPKPSDSPPLAGEARLVVLGLLTIYLIYDWRLMNKPRDPWAWSADTIHAILIIGFALMVQAGREPMDVALITLLAATGALHLTPLWESPKAVKCGCRRFALCFTNLGGIGVLVIARDLFGPEKQYHLPIAMGAVLIPWFFLRRP